MILDYDQPVEAAELCERLEALEIDFVELSGGNYEDLAFVRKAGGARESTLKREAFFTEVRYPRHKY